MTNPAPGPLNHVSFVAEHQGSLELMLDSLGGPQLDFCRPSPAGRYNHRLGGKDNVEADRWSATQLQTALPSVRLAAAELCRSVERQVAYLTGRGIRQFLDSSCGMPHHPDIHAIARTIDPTCEVVYVDSDELVSVDYSAMHIGTEQGVIEVLDGNLTDIDAILYATIVCDVLDFDQPTGVLLLAVLHFIADDQLAHAAIEKIKAALAPGSCLAVTHLKVVDAVAYAATGRLP